MPNILGTMARRSASFRPASASDVLAIQVARILSDPSGIAYYGEVCRRYPVPKIAEAIQRADRDLHESSARERVDKALGNTTVDDGGATPVTVGVKIERRVLGAAVFRGARLIDTLFRHLPSGKDGAQSAVMSALTWLTEQYLEASVGIETLDVPDTRRAELGVLAKAKLREQGVAIWELTAREVLESYGLPDAPARPNCRATARQLWPSLATEPNSDVVADAALLGYAVLVRKCLAVVGERSEPTRS